MKEKLPKKKPIKDVVLPSRSGFPYNRHLPDETDKWNIKVGKVGPMAVGVDKDDIPIPAHYNEGDREYSNDRQEQTLKHLKRLMELEKENSKK